jgi:L-seryl-tRNA(Ser) seleniumtransferase
MSDSREKSRTQELLRNLPSVDSLLREHQDGSLFGELSRSRFLILSRDAVGLIRDAVLNGTLEIPISEENEIKSFLKEKVIGEIEKGFHSQRINKLQHVINATGVVIHTNLGRAPLSERARNAVMMEASRYCNLEFDIATGLRGVRGGRALELLASITGAEDALVVNNCAAATMLVLSSLAAGGETIVSRGELVEIGGDFRVPDVMQRSGTILREVGTTNRTRISDFAEAITENTKVLLSVHSSNFKIVGFTSKVSISELAEFGKKHNIVVYEDAGSGVISDFDFAGMDDEPNILESISRGVDIVTFSGDKLMGGLQCGIIVGKKSLIEKVRKNPLYRALRFVKLFYAWLEATLESFADGTELDDLPVLRLLTQSRESLLERTKNFIDKHFQSEKDALQVVDGNSVIGGGTTPGEEIPSVCIAIKSDKVSSDNISERLRLLEIPIVARISDEKVLIDLRTVFEDEEESLAKGIKSALI